MKVTTCDRCKKICSEREANSEIHEVKISRVEEDKSRASGVKTRQLDLCDVCRAQLINWLDNHLGYFIVENNKESEDIRQHGKSI